MSHARYLRRGNRGRRRQLTILLAISTAIALTLSLGTMARADGVWQEQQGHHGADTFTNYHNASGLGPRVAPGAWVNVSCKIHDPYIQSANPDGYWYRLSDSPWNNQYYAVANTFMNGDPWDGPYTHNTDFNVPDCGSSPPPAPPSPAPAPPGPSVSLAQGPTAPKGYRYAVTLDNFSPNTAISVTCFDSVTPAGFWPFSLTTDGSGHAATSAQCYSADGPDHWVVADGVTSNHVDWGAAPEPPDNPGGGAVSPPIQSRKTATPNSPPAPAKSAGPVAPGTPEPTVKDPCIATYKDGGTQRTKAIFGGSETDYDRTASLYQTCEGFGAPDGLAYTPGMQCALIAAAAVWGGPVVNVDVSRGCDAGGFYEAAKSGDWLGFGKDVACGFVSDLFAGGVGIATAGAASETGPGAVTIGVNTYKALNSALHVFCGAIFEGGASTFGYNYEAKHETAVLLDIEKKGKCLQERRVFGFISWSAPTC